MVRDNLNDPESVKFNEIIISKKGHRACAVWNAKNKMGGYGGWKVANLEKIESNWKVKMNGFEFNCTEKAFADLDAIAEAKTNGLLRAVELLLVARTTYTLEEMPGDHSYKVALGLSHLPNECRSLAYLFSIMHESLGESRRFSVSKMEIDFYNKKISLAEEVLRAGDCSDFLRDEIFGITSEDGLLDLEARSKGRARAVELLLNARTEHSFDQIPGVGFLEKALRGQKLLPEECQDHSKIGGSPIFWFEAMHRRNIQQPSKMLSAEEILQSGDCSDSVENIHLNRR